MSISTLRDIVRHLITSDEFLARIVAEELWKPELVDTPLSRQVARWCFRFFRKYGKAPGAHIESYFNDRRDKLDEDTAEQVEMLLQSLSDDQTEQGQTSDINYLLERTRSHFRQQAHKHYAAEYADLVEQGEIEAAAALPRPASDLEALPPAIRRASEIKSKPVQWLLPGYLPRGYPTLLAGRPDAGKSQFTIWIAARVSRGAPWGKIGHGRARRGDVLMVSSEDGAADVIRPRLDVQNADNDRVHILEGVPTRDTDEHACMLPWTLQNLDVVRRFLDQQKSLRRPCRLMVVDPISSVMPDARGSENSAVRRAIAPLARLVEEYNIALLLVTHLRKDHTGTALERILDSTAWVALPRSVLIFGRDPDNPDQRVVSLAKHNLGKEMPSFNYRIETAEIDPVIGPQPLVVIEGTSTVDADAALSRPASPEERSQQEEIQEWLRDLLKDGPVPTRRVFKYGADPALGYSVGQIRRAAKKLKIKKEKSGFKDGWVWKVSRR